MQRERLTVTLKVRDTVGKDVLPQQTGQTVLIHLFGEKVEKGTTVARIEPVVRTESLCVESSRKQGGRGGWLSTESKRRGVPLGRQKDTWDHTHRDLHGATTFASSSRPISS